MATMAASRDDIIPLWGQHKSPRDIALYMRSVGDRVGKEYKTHGEVWDADSALKTGLLHLILDKLESSNQTDEALRGHREWLTVWHKKILKMVAMHQKERDRLVKMFGHDKIGPDMNNHFTVHESSLAFRTHRRRHFGRCRDLAAKVKRMRSVRKPEDAANLDSIGKKRTEQLLAKLKTKQQTKRET
jgi:hypothetical protein